MKKLFLFLIMTQQAFAEEISLHQQQIENAVPNQTAIDLSAKKLREHKNIEIGEKLAIPPFHKQTGELETAPQSFCRTCHSPLPHQKALRTRTFNNMHVRFIACETCHVENEKLTYRWFDMEKQQFVFGENLFRIGKNIDNENPRPANPKIAPFLNDSRIFLLKGDEFAKQIAATWKSANESEKAVLHAKIHAPLNWQKTENSHQGTPCQECHNDKKSKLDLQKLGATTEQIQAIQTHIIPRFLEHYKNDDQRITIREMLR
jgi:nitrate/TMAO reductase-like tetraheme cytochrome c subunit